jgi:hypothetical protein
MMFSDEHAAEARPLIHDYEVQREVTTVEVL